MNKKVISKILFAVFAVALCAAAYFAADIPFFQFDDYEYQDKGAALFSTQWLSAMLPFGIILLVSAVCIALDVLLRKLLYKKEKLPVGKTGIMARDKRKKRLVFGFETVRWIVMILSFALLIFGGESTRYFVLALLLGVVIGTYSSIFNASQLLVAWSEGEIQRFFRRVTRRPDPEPQASEA